jgi:hypothetical protein
VQYVPSIAFFCFIKAIQESKCYGDDGKDMSSGYGDDGKDMSSGYGYDVQAMSSGYWCPLQIR